MVSIREGLESRCVSISSILQRLSTSLQACLFSVSVPSPQMHVTSRSSTEEMESRVSGRERMVRPDEGTGLLGRRSSPIVSGKKFGRPVILLQIRGSDSSGYSGEPCTRCMPFVSAVLHADMDAEGEGYGLIVALQPLQRQLLCKWMMRLHRTTNLIEAWHR